MPDTRQNSQAESLPTLVVEGPRGTRTRWLRSGRNGNLQTVAQMIALVRESATQDLGLDRFAAQILRDAGLDGHSPNEDQLRAIFDYVKTHIQYVHDPAGRFEFIKSARHTLHDGFGDCDDLSILLASLLAAIGFSPRIVIARYDSTNQGYDHVYIDVTANARRYVLDATPRGGAFDQEPQGYLERRVFEINGRAWDVELASASANLQRVGRQLRTLSPLVKMVPLVGDRLADYLDGGDETDLGAAQFATGNHLRALAQKLANPATTPAQAEQAARSAGRIVRDFCALAKEVDDPSRQDVTRAAVASFQQRLNEIRQVAASHARRNLSGGTPGADHGAKFPLGAVALTIAVGYAVYLIGKGESL